MSQFFESYHLRAQSQEDAVELLRRASLRGYVFPESDGWASFVCEGEPFAVNEPLQQANEGKLLQFAYSEDHGWSFVVIAENRVVFAYDSPGLDYPGTSAAEAEDARFIRHFDWLNADERKRMWELLFAKPGTVEHLAIAFEFARLIGLKHFEGISYEALEEPPDLRAGARMVPP